MLSGAMVRRERRVDSALSLAALRVASCASDGFDVQIERTLAIVRHDARSCLRGVIYASRYQITGSGVVLTVKR
jgi:hypothetical protein